MAPLCQEGIRLSLPKVPTLYGEWGPHNLLLPLHSTRKGTQALPKGILVGTIHPKMGRRGGNSGRIGDHRGHRCLLLYGILAAEGGRQTEGEEKK